MAHRCFDRGAQPHITGCRCNGLLRRAGRDQPNRLRHRLPLPLLRQNLNRFRRLPHFIDPRLVDRHSTLGMAVKWRSADGLCSLSRYDRRSGGLHSNVGIARLGTFIAATAAIPPSATTPTATLTGFSLRLKFSARLLWTLGPLGTISAVRAA